MRSAGALLPPLLTLLMGCSPADEPAATPSPSSASRDPGRPLPSPLPDVVARVDGQPILLVQILPMARREMQASDEEEEEVARNRALRRALERYIDRELLFQEARSRGISADQAALDWAIDQARLEHPDEESWTAFLAEQGLDPQSFKTEMRVQHTVSALLRAEGAGGPIGDDEARQVYEANPSAFVSLGQTPPPFDDVRNEVKTILAQRQLEAATGRLLEELRGRARIEIFL